MVDGLSQHYAHAEATEWVKNSLDGMRTPLGPLR